MDSGQRARGRRPVEPGEKQGTGASEEPDEGVRRGSGLLPEVGDAPRRVDDRWLPGLVDNRGYGRPDVSAWHQDEPSAAEVDHYVHAVVDDHDAVAPGQP